MRYLLILLFCLAATGQTVIFGGGKAASIIGPSGTTLPASCSGRVLFDLTADDGGATKGLYRCDAGTYTKIGPSVGAGEGDVTGPAASVAGEAAVYDGITGKLLKRFAGTGLGLFTSGVLSVDSGLQFNGTTKALGVFGPITSGQTSNYLGQILLNGITSGTITIQPANAAGTWTWTLPANDGDANQVLQTNGSGVTSWATPSGGSMVYPGAGVPNSTGSAWGTSYAVGTSANNLVQLTAGAALPAVSAANLTSFPTLNQNTTGNAATATALATARAIGGVNFDGTAAIVPQTVQVVDSTDTSSSIAMFDAATGNQQPKTDAGLTYNAGTGVLTATGFAGPITGAVTGNASTATALAANGANCSAGQYPLGVDASGAAENCTAAGDVINSSGSGVPTGNCTLGKATYVDTATGRTYTCSATNTWSEILTTSGTTAGALILSELRANGENFRKWLVPDALTADLTFLYPNSVPTAGQTMAFSAPSSDVSTISWINPATAASGGSLTTSGAYGITLTATGTTGVTLPTSGTLATTAGNVATATALAANGANCSGTLALGVDASGACEGTATPTLGTAGSVVGSLAFANATSGSITLAPATGALGSTALTLPAVSGTLMSNPMTTAEDLIVGGTSGAPGRLGKGSEGQALKIVSGVVAWGTDSTGGSPAFSDVAAGTNTNALVVGTNGSLGTSGTGTITATALSAQYINWSSGSGATSIANKPNVATAAASGSLTTSGAYAVTLTATAETNVTLPTTGTLLASGTGTADASVTDASTTAKGKVELAIASEVTTGSSSSLAVTPDALRGSDYGKKVFLLEVFEDATALATGDGKLYIPVPTEYAGWNVVAVSAHVGSAISSSGAVDVDIARCAAVATGIRCSGTVADVLSTDITIDANEDGSETAATAAVINTDNDDLPTAGHLRIDVDGAGTGTKGLIIRIVVQKP